MAYGKPNQSQDRNGEAQNVETSADQQDQLAGNRRDVEHATDKAMQGMNQGRDASQRSGNNALNRGVGEEVDKNSNDEKGRG